MVCNKKEEKERTEINKTSIYQLFEIEYRIDGLKNLQTNTPNNTDD